MMPDGIAIRPWLRWLLVGAMVLTGLALWWPEARVVSVVAQTQLPAIVQDGGPIGPGRGTGGVEVAPTPLPTRIVVPLLEKATFDPFVGVEVRPPPQPKPPPTVAPPPPLPVMPPTRQVPPQNYRFLGSLLDPGGKQWVYLARGDAALTVAVGAQLEEGYVVEAIDAQGVHLLYAPMDARVVIPIPPAPTTPNR